MIRVERSFENKRVLSVDDEIIIIYGYENPNTGDGTHATKGTLFVEEPPSANEAAFWIKRQSDDPHSWETWGMGDEVGSVTIDPSDTEVVDQISLAAYDTIKWIINIDDGVTKSQSFEILAREKDDEVDYSRYAIIGERINFGIDMSVGSGNIIFSITNNEANTVTVKFRRSSL